MRIAVFAGLILLTALGAGGAVAKAEQQPGGITAPPVGEAPQGGPVYANPAPPGPGIPRDDILDVMVRSALMTFNDANLTGNYAVMSARLHAEFRQQVPAEKLAEIFKAFRENKIDIAPLLAHKTVYTESPSIDSMGILSAKGQLETRPWRTSFELTWRREENRWWLWKINVRVRPPA
jgi:hypothetical protein